MKKFLKIFTYFLVLAGGIALAICYMVIPQETKYAMDVVVEYINKPLPIVGLSIAALSVILFNFLSRTSIGKKALNKLTNKIDYYEKMNADFVNKVDNTIKDITDEINKFKEDSENKIEEYKNEYEDKAKAMNTKFDYIESNLMETLKQIPNKKVQDCICEFENKYEEIKLQTDLVIGSVNDKVVDYKEEQENRFHELEVKFIELKEEFENERKEAIDSKTEEE